MNKTKEFFENINKNTNGEYTLISPFEKVLSKITIQHNICGNTFTMRPNDFVNGHRCPFCANKARAKKSTYTIEKYKAEIAEKYGDEYEILSDSLVKLSDRISIRHSCGHIYKAEARNLLKRGMGCRYCSYKKTAEAQRGIPKPNKNVKSHGTFLQEFQALYGDDYQLLGTYKTSKTPIEILHKPCGTKYNAIPNNLLNNQTKCPKCTAGQTSSAGELELFNYIKSIYSGKIEKNYRDEHSYELDIYLPELKIGIEYDGLYWHSEKKVGKKYHLEKMNYFNKKDIRVINIFEDEWQLKQSIIKRKIASILGVSQEERVYARNCEIRDVKSQEKGIFLENNHAQGNDHACFISGLYYNNELVAVMTFCKPRKSLGSSSGNWYELSRYATSKNVVGGFSKLLNYMQKKYNIKEIKTFADLRFSSPDKNVYLANGFELTHKSSPGYFYCLNSQRYHRFGFRKQELEKKFPNEYDKNLTEFEIMDKTKYFRIWDCGNLVYRKIYE